MNLKGKIEAVLFLTDKPIHAAAVARIVNTDVQLVRKCLLELIHDYEERAGGLEIAQDNGYMIQVKDEFAAIVEEFLPMDMSVALLRTLSAIAIKQPVVQSEIVRVRGAGAYDHIKELLSRELVFKKEEGRSPTLTTTRKFQEYFRLTGDARGLRQDIKKQEAKLAALAASTGSAQLGLPLPHVPHFDGEPGVGVSTSKFDAAIEKLLDTAIDVVSGEAEMPEGDPEVATAQAAARQGSQAAEQLPGQDW